MAPRRADSALLGIQQFQLAPDVLMFGPIDRFLPGDLQFGHFQCAMAVRADVFSVRTADLQHPRPRSAADRHAQAPQTRPATISLIENSKVKESRGNQEENEDSE